MFRPGRVFLPPEVLKGQRGDEAGLDETSIKRVEGESSLIISPRSAFILIPSRRDRYPILSNVPFFVEISLPSFSFVFSRFKNRGIV